MGTLSRLTHKLANVSEVMAQESGDRNHLEFRAGELWHQADGAGLLINCLEGVIWVTEEGDLNDRIIKAGERFLISGRGLVVLEALTDAQICLKAA